MNETENLSKEEGPSLAEKVLYNLPILVIGLFVVVALAHEILG